MFWHNLLLFLPHIELMKLVDMNINTAIKKINAAIHKRKVLELFYQTDDGNRMYFTVAPVCLHEYEGKLYLLSLDQDDTAYAFEIARIKAMDEYWATFSLSDKFSLNYFQGCLFNKGNHINGYIMVENDLNPEKLRKELQSIEADIKAVVGLRRIGTGWTEVAADIDYEKLENLLHSRRNCLNRLFRKDPKGLESFRKVNDALRGLTDKMYKKAARIYRQYLISGVDEEFDDDFMINADLRFLYNSEESIAKLDDEEYYGSDFCYMMELISDLRYDAPLVGASFSKGFRREDKPEMSDKELELDNEMDRFCWGELRLSIPEVEGIKICHAVNEICVYDNGYSVPDLLRMNDFWCEVKAIYQHVRDQNGKNSISEQ